MDQDAPAPAGDDFQVPEFTTPVILRNPDEIIRVDRSFQKPTHDEVIASGGAPALTESPDCRSPADRGRHRRHLHREHEGAQPDRGREGGPGPDGDTSRMREVPPDVYFRVTLASGKQIDTRHVFGLGLLLNQTGAHLGTREQPIVLFSALGAVSDPGPHTPCAR